MKQNYFVSQQENLLETWEKVFFSHSFIRHKKRSRKLGKTCAEMLYKSGWNKQEWRNERDEIAPRVRSQATKVFHNHSKVAPYRGAAIVDHQHQSQKTIAVSTGLRQCTSRHFSRKTT